MSELSLVTLRAKNLRRPSEEVSKEIISTPEFQKYCDEMIEAMKKFNGVGLAGVQVGDNRRIAVVQTEAGPEIIINPKIYSKSKKQNVMEEGCLSIPKHFGSVPRSHKIDVSYTNREGKRIRKKVRGFAARIFQHEIDHMDGKLFVDRI